MAFDDADASALSDDRTRIVARDDETPERQAELIAESKEYRLNYWDKIGKEGMEKLIDFNPNMPEEWRKRFMDKTWEFRDVYGQDTQAISGGVSTFAVHIAKNERPIKPSKQRNSSKFSKKL